MIVSHIRIQSIKERNTKEIKVEVKVEVKIKVKFST
jgi:hypothetical protein